MGPFDRITLKGVTGLAPGKQLTLVGKRPDGTTYEFPVGGGEKGILQCLGTEGAAGMAWSFARLMAALRVCSPCLVCHSPSPSLSTLPQLNHTFNDNQIQVRSKCLLSCLCLHLPCSLSHWNPCPTSTPETSCPLLTCSILPSLHAHAVVQARQRAKRYGCQQEVKSATDPPLLLLLSPQQRLCLPLRRRRQLQVLTRELRSGRRRRGPT